MALKSYQTIQNSAETELMIERSRFIGHCSEVASEPDAKDFIAKVRAEHAQATHNCYAYRIGITEHPLEYFNDHGEPSGTAGKPILGAIQRFNLTNVIVVVTRYFGGKKLGVRGLIEAYGEAASLVLEKAGIMQKIPRYKMSLVYAYQDHSLILYRLQQLDAEVGATLFTEVITNEVLIPEEKRADFEVLIKELPLLKIIPNSAKR